jgi:hypothetical protein
MTPAGGAGSTSRGPSDFVLPVSGKAPTRPVRIQRHTIAL